MPASVWLRRARASISGVMSTPYAVPCGPTRRAEQDVQPTAGPGSRTSSPGVSSARAVGLPHPSDASSAAAETSPAPWS